MGCKSQEVHGWPFLYFMWFQQQYQSKRAWKVKTNQLYVLTSKNIKLFTSLWMKSPKASLVWWPLHHKWEKDFTSLWIKSPKASLIWWTLHHKWKRGFTSLWMKSPKAFPTWWFFYHRWKKGFCVFACCSHINVVEPYQCSFSKNKYHQTCRYMLHKVFQSNSFSHNFYFNFSNSLCNCYNFFIFYFTIISKKLSFSFSLRFQSLVAYV